MNGSQCIKSYFCENAPPGLPRGMAKRAANALYRAGIHTMSDLACTPPERIAKAPSVGRGCLALAMLLREEYRRVGSSSSSSSSNSSKIGSV